MLSKNRCAGLYLTLLMAFFMLNAAPCDAQKKQISVAVLSINEQQMALFSQQFQAFNQQQSEFVVEFDFYSDEGHKAKLASWLESGKYDLIHWQAGKRLTDIVAQELILPIENLLDKQNINASVSHQLLDAVRINGVIQALPFGYYPWGFYYSKPIFQRLGLEPPKSWADFLALCATLKQQGVAPLVQANQEGWPLLAWLDFLALDIGGVKTRNQALEYGLLSRDAIEEITAQFSQLLSLGYFFAPDYHWRWEQALTLLKRQHAAMTLLGQFAESELKFSNEQSLGYFPFPFSNATKSQPIVAPIDVFIVPLASNYHHFLPKLLAFLARPETNKALATGLGFLPVVNEFDGSGLTQRQKVGLATLRNSQQLLQLFDRDAEALYATNLANSISQSILLGESSSLKSALLGEEYVQRDLLQSPTDYSEPLLNFSSFTGSKGSFFASNVLKVIYQKLGYRISVTRYQSVEQNIKSYKYGADGELVRAKAYAAQSTDLIPMDEPLAENSLLLVCRNHTACEQPLPSKTPVAASLQIVALQDWWQKEGAAQQQYPNLDAMFKAYQTGQIDFMLMSSLDIQAFSEQLKASHFRTILTIPFYHYVHSKHKHLLPRLNNELRAFKKLPSYQALRTRYWLN